MFDWLHDLTDQRRQELIRESEHQTLVRLALESQERRPPFYYSILADLGRQLSVVGEQLQERYGQPPALEKAMR